MLLLSGASVNEAWRLLKRSWHLKVANGAKVGDLSDMLKELKNLVAPVAAQLIGRTESEVYKLLEVPKSLEHGHLALPVFALAKERRMAPPMIAKELAAQFSSQKIEGMNSVAAVSGFVNFSFDELFVQNTLAKSVLGTNKLTLGYSNFGHGKRVVIDYSSPNVAKPMHVGHLRATVIGQAIKNLAVTQGFDVIGLNHLGDWGVQFGKLAWAYQAWSQDYDLNNEPFKALLAMYVRFHEEAEKDPAIEEYGAKTFLRLEAGDAEIKALWQKFVDITLSNNQKLYNLLGVQHELVRGESFYSDRIDKVEEILREKHLLVESEGAQVVRLDELNLPPCLIRKTDGATLYATRDLASLMYRFKELKADINLYVVAQDQALHFEQIFAVFKKMGFPQADNCHHIQFGLYRFKDQSKISTRKGNVVLLEDLLNRAMDLTREIISQKNPDLANKELVAQQVGVGAVIFNDLVNDRVRNVDFDWDQVLDFNGTTGPYVQYSQVRCRSLIKKYNKAIPTETKFTLNERAERELIRLALNYSETLRSSWENFKPSILAQYLIDLAQAFGTFYQQHRIMGEAADLQEARMMLVSITQKILENGLRVLSVDSPEAM